MTIVDDINMDESKYYLGRICKWGHEWRDSGKSIRLKSAGDCLGCNRVYKKETKQRITEQRKNQPNILIQDFDFTSGLYTLGHLCPTRHNYQGTDQSVRLLSNNHCYYCRKDYYAKTAEHQIEKSRQYRLANPEKVKQTYLAWYYRPEVYEYMRQCRQRYYQENKEYLNARSRDYNKNNRAKITLRCRLRRQLPEVRLTIRAAQRRREKRLREAQIVKYTGADILLRYQLFDNVCAYCGKDQDITDDHVVAIYCGGYDCPENIVPACRKCNSSKHIKPLIPWYKKQPFFSEERLFRVLDALGEFEKEVVLNSFVVTN